jgi:alpha-glucosidase
MTVESSPEPAQWWRGASLYEVYVRSFRDSNGDGEGDLKGLIDKIDYLAELGVDGIWLTPIFPSPMHDSGYDVSDYRAIDPRFGTFDDFALLFDKARARGLHVVLDQVYSHSSDEHPWFVESASSHDNPKADWYVWADAAPDGTAPNNWMGRFGGTAWEWSPVRRQYYLHNFLTQQPDLNLHNPDVQKEVLDIMRFWFEAGVDGLRLDVANFFMHDPLLRSNPPVRTNEVPSNPYYLQAHIYDRSRPETLPFLTRMRELSDAMGERMLLAEISCDNQIERMVEYTRPGRLHTAYSFELLQDKLDGRHIASCIEEASRDESWPTWAFSNHDVVRVASRWNAEQNNARVQLFQALLGCLHGNIIFYQGEELGLTHSDVPRAQLQDPEAIRFWPQHRGRDGARTPMPWTAETPALGFSDVDGWLPAEKDHAPLNVAEQEANPASNLNHFRSIMQLRREEDALRLGTFELIEATKESIAFCRRLNDTKINCIFNFGSNPLPFKAAGIILAGADTGKEILSNQYVIMKEAL